MVNILTVFVQEYLSLNEIILLYPTIALFFLKILKECLDHDLITLNSCSLELEVRVSPVYAWFEFIIHKSN